jgi:hypothetical protein
MNIPDTLKSIPLPLVKGEGGLVEVYGGPDTGKSTLCYQWIGAAMKTWDFLRKSVGLLRSSKWSPTGR